MKQRVRKQQINAFRRPVDKETKTRRNINRLISIQGAVKTLISISAAVRYSRKNPWMDSLSKAAKEGKSFDLGQSRDFGTLSFDF